MKRYNEILNMPPGIATLEQGEAGIMQPTTQNGCTESATTWTDQ